MRDGAESKQVSKVEGEWRELEGWGELATARGACTRGNAPSCSPQAIGSGDGAQKGLFAFKPSMIHGPTPPCLLYSLVAHRPPTDESTSFRSEGQALVAALAVPWLHSLRTPPTQPTLALFCILHIARQ